MRYTAGQFNRNDWPLYFLASGPGTLEKVTQSAGAILIAVNELMTESGPGLLEQILNSGVKVFLDSGAFSLANRTAKERGIPLYEALQLPIDELSGFQNLYNSYVQLTTTFGSRLWGYIELDLGGREQKRAMRTKLEAAGFSPIPVYHPLTDGWDYFDELAENYDRICIGGIVQASAYIRHRIVATIFDRLQRYPDRWVHLLGYTPDQFLNACPLQSCDSSTWLQTVRWDGYKERAMLRPIGGMPKNFQYQLGNRATWEMGWRMGAYGSWLSAMNWRQHVRRLEVESLLPLSRPVGSDVPDTRAISF